jgi:Right handed beta helix region
MKKFSILKKNIVIGICLLFIVTAIFPSSISEKSHSKKIITVDDDGDGDYTCIKEALNNASSGDTIEIYSGTYYEQGITVNCSNIIIIGISEELGQGNGTGKPFFQGNGNEDVLTVTASHVSIANLRIENGVTGLYIGIGEASNLNNITVTNTSVRNCSGGIVCCAVGKGIVLTDNDIQKCRTHGMMVSGYPKGVLCSNNTIADCNSYGIDTECDHV